MDNNHTEVNPSLLQDVKPLNIQAESYLPLSLALSCFFLPLSPSLSSVFFAISAVLTLVLPSFYHSLKQVCQSTWCKLAFALFAFVLLSALWSDASSGDAVMIIKRYTKLLYLPLLTVGFRSSKARNLSIMGFLAAMLLTCILSILQALGILALHPNDFGEVFYNHIITGFMMAIASYFAGVWFFQSQGWRALLLMVLVLLFSAQILYVNTGRTGYVVYGVLMGLLFFRYLSRKQMLIGAVVLVLGCILSYYTSPAMQERLHAAVHDIQGYSKDDKNTAIGYRLQFHDYAKSLFLKHPIFGNGVGSFHHNFHKDNPVPSYGDELIEPHSQYWLIAVEQGVIGLGIFGLFLGSLFYSLWQLKAMQPILLGVLVPFCLSFASDSLLIIYPIGKVLIYFVALAFGERVARC